MFLPPEILLPIFEDLPETDARSCALVCRSWVSASRFYAFRLLRLDLNKDKPASALRFLKLCNSPFETFTAAGIRTLVIKHCYTEWTTRAQETLTLEEIWEWRFSNNKKSISAIFSSVRCLHLHHLDLPPYACLPSTIFGGVKELHFYYSRFATQDAFLNVLGSFATLDSFEMTGCMGPFGDVSTDGQRPESKDSLAFRSTLRTISLHSVKDAKLVGCLLPCTGLRTLRVALHSLTASPFHDAQVVVEVRRLMAAARTSLTGMKLDLTGNSAISEFLSSLEKDPLSHYPRLRELELIMSDDELVPFLDAISRGSWKSNSPSPLVVLRIPSLNSRKTSSQWRNLDDILQRPYFSSLEQIVPHFYVAFRSRDAIQQPKALSHTAPDPSSSVGIMLQEDIIRLQEHLPKSFERGIITPHIDYCFIPDPVQVYRPQLTQPTTVPRPPTTFGRLKALVRKPFYRFR